jgi:protoporphyrinogen oxidase
MPELPVVIVGAGPAGLTASAELVDRGIPIILIEKSDRVGGIARTDTYKGYRFDIGGHRFFTRVPWVMEFWKNIMGDDFLKRPRLSRIYYQKQFYHYPIKPLEVLRKFGITESLRVVLSYLHARAHKRPREQTFEDYIVNHFGKRLFHHFFKSYTEKVWGVPTSEIRASWAAQRIKGMSIWSMLKTALFPKHNTHTSLIEQFYYPRLGPGQMWERALEKVQASGKATVHFSSTPVVIRHQNGRVESVDIKTPQGIVTVPCRAVISSMPIGELITLHSPALPADVQYAAAQLRYRDFLTVALIVTKEHLFPDNWIYIHDAAVRVGRIQNFKNWSPELVPDQKTTCVGLEYFVFETDELWKKSDADLVAMATEELVQLGLAKHEDIVDGCVVRMQRAYPMYNASSEEALPVIQKALGEITNLYPVGRNGMHKYNNQDHAMYTAKLAVENIFGATNDIWGVNVERVYHEEVERPLHGSSYS